MQCDLPNASSLHLRVDGELLIEHKDAWKSNQSFVSVLKQVKDTDLWYGTATCLPQCCFNGAKNKVSVFALLSEAEPHGRN